MSQDRASSPPPGQDHRAYPPAVGRSSHGTPVVGVGASAGGVSAIQTLLRPLSSDVPYAIVVVVHLNPEHESQYAEVLRSSTDLSVQEVSGTADIRPGHVYVVPPGQHTQLSEGALHTRPFGDPTDRRHTIDHFFQSLAEADTLAGVAVLSGGGTDGAQGVTAVKSEGGFILVQDPDEAEHESMPRAAINTAIVDSVLPAREIGIAFLEMLQTSQQRLVEAGSRSAETDEDSTDAESVKHILQAI